MCWTRVAAESMRDVDGAVDKYFRELSQQRMVINRMRKLNEKVVKNTSGPRNQGDRIFIFQRRECQRKEKIKRNISSLVV